MSKIEKFLNSGYYIAFIFLITFVSWANYKETPPYYLNLSNMFGMMTIIFLMAIILSFYKNTLYIVPNIFGLLFIVNKSNLTFEAFESFGFYYVAFIVFLIGPIVHLIRFKPKFKKGQFFLGFFLIALSYVMPMIYLDFSMSLFVVSMMGFLYLLVYIFFNSTMKGNVAYLYRLMLFTNLLMVAQVFFYVYQGMLLIPEATIYEQLLNGWNRNLGWANINDMCFYIALTFPAYVHYIFKYPKSMLYWMLSVLPIAAVLLSKSRGGIVGFSAVLGMLFIYVATHANKRVVINGLMTLGFVGILSYVGQELYVLWYEYIVDSWNGDWNTFSSNRIEIYKGGMEVFLRYPIFGGGWQAAINMFGSRIFMWHSTIGQSLAAMGLFGLVALVIHYVEIGKFFSKKKLIRLLLIGYLASQVHGLIDNVQYAVPYSVVIIIMLVMVSSNQNNHRFN